MKINSLLTLMVLSFIIFSCSSQRVSQKTKETIAVADLNQWGDNIIQGVEEDLIEARDDYNDVSNKKSWLNWTNVSVGIVGGATVAAFKPEDTKESIGIGLGIVTAVIGALQLIPDDNEVRQSFIVDAEDLISEWNRLVLAGNISNEEFYKFLEKAKKIKRKAQKIGVDFSWTRPTIN